VLRNRDVATRDDDAGSALDGRRDVIVAVDAGDLFI
jgi:hypothetical protein